MDRYFVEGMDNTSAGEKVKKYMFRYYSINLIIMGALVVSRAVVESHLVIVVANLVNLHVTSGQRVQV